MAKKEENKKKKVKEEVKSNKKNNIKKEEIKKESKKRDDKIMKFIEFIDKYRLAIYGIIGGILATLLVVILIWPDRIATLKDGTQPVAEIDGLVVTADDLYEDMKQIYSISSLLDKLDNSILLEKYEETDEMNDEVQDQATNYYNMYKAYYGIEKEEFLTRNGFGSEKAFLEYLKLQYRRNKYTEDYIKKDISDSEIKDYYDDKVYGDINTKHILVKVDSSASDEEKKEAEDKAKEIISKLNDGKTFDEVREEYKDDITYEELGYKSYNANLESAYLEEMQKLEDNSYSKTPVKTSYGYHIVYRIDQKEKPSLEDVKEEIISTLVDEKKSKDENIQYKALDNMRKEANLKLSEIEYTNNNGIIEIKSEDIITQIGWTKREEYKYNYLLGIFEGANDQSFSDAVPIAMIREQGGLNEVNYIDVNIPSSYKYIRYIPPNKNNTDISPIKIYGQLPSELNLNEKKDFQVTNLPLVSIHTENSVFPTQKDQEIN